MGLLFGRDRVNASSEVSEKVSVREISSEDTELLQKAYDLITGGSWSDEEKEGFDLGGELKDPQTYKVGIFHGNELIGFAAASTLASPNFQPGSKYPQGKDMWCGYFVLEPNFRNNIRVVSQFRELYSKLLEHALKSGKDRILSCTENPLMLQLLPTLGWHFVEETDIIDKLGRNIGRTSVFEYPKNHA